MGGKGKIPPIPHCPDEHDHEKGMIREHFHYVLALTFVANERNLAAIGIAGSPPAFDDEADR